MEEKNTVHLGSMLGNLTMDIVKTTRDIDSMQKLFADDRIVIEENYVEDFVSAVEKLFSAINKCERGN